MAAANVAGSFSLAVLAALAVEVGGRRAVCEHRHAVESSLPGGRGGRGGRSTHDFWVM